MAVRRSKQESELLTDAKIEAVIGMLEPSTAEIKPCSKKDACSFLGIAYNTTRLDTILKEYKEKKELDATRRKEKRGKPATKEEIKFCVESYILENMAIKSIADALYRSVDFVNLVLKQSGVTMRPISHDYFHPSIISDNDARDRFEVGEVVYNARYNVNCIIKTEYVDAKYGYVYKVWLLGDYQQYAFTAYYDLGSLDILKKVASN